MTPRALIHATLHAITSGLGSKLFGFITLAIVTQTLSVYEFGYYVLLQSIVSIAGIVYCISSGALIQSEIAVALGRGDAVLAKSIWAQAARWQATAFVLVTSCAIAAFGTLYGAGVDLPFDYVIPVLAAFGASGLRDFMLVTCAANGNFKFMVRWQVLEGLLRLLAVSGLVYLDSLSISRLLLLDAFAIFATFLVVRLELVRSAGWLKGSAIKGQYLEGVMKAHGKWFALRTALVEISGNGRSWLIAGIVSVEAVGVFAIAKRIIQFVKVFMPLGSVLTTYFSAAVDHPERAATAFGNGTRVALLMGLVLAVGAAIITPIITTIFFGQFGMELNYAAWVLCLALIPKALTYVVLSFLNADKKQKSAMSMVMLGLLAMIALTPLFAYFFGIVGVAVESVVTGVLSLWFGYRQLVKARPELKLDFQRAITVDSADIVRIWRHVIAASDTPKSRAK